MFLADSELSHAAVKQNEKRKKGERVHCLGNTEREGGTGVMYIIIDASVALEKQVEYTYGTSL